MRGLDLNKDYNGREEILSSVSLGNDEEVPEDRTFCLFNSKKKDDDDDLCGCDTVTRGGRSGRSYKCSDDCGDYVPGDSGCTYTGSDFSCLTNEE